MVHISEIRTKRKATLEATPLVVELLDPELRAGGAKCLWESLERQLASKVVAVVIESTENCERVRLIVYQEGGYVGIYDAELPSLLQHWTSRQRAKCGGATHVEIALHNGASSTSQSPMVGAWENILSVIKSNKPPDFDPEEVRKEKEKYFKSYQRLAGPEREWDRDAFSTLVDEFLADVGSQAALSNGGREAIATLESKVGVVLPPEFGTLLERVPPNDPVFFGYCLLSPTKILETWNTWNEIFLSWSLKELKSHITSSKGHVYPVYTCPHWIPFLEVEQNFLCLDLLPGKKGKLGQVIAMGRDLDRRSIVANGLWSWLDYCRQKTKGTPLRVLP